jgi:hypothetical protein
MHLLVNTLIIRTCMEHKTEVRYGGMDWIELAQDRDKWQALVNVGLNLWVP